MFAFMGIKMLQKCDKLYYILSLDHYRIYFYKNWHCVFSRLLSCLKSQHWWVLDQPKVTIEPPSALHDNDLATFTQPSVFCHCTDSGTRCKTQCQTNHVNTRGWRGKNVWGKSTSILLHYHSVVLCTDESSLTEGAMAVFLDDSSK